MSPEHLERLPRIAVLLATYNGRRWLPEQLSSILAQQDVDVRVVALDDSSIDGTVDYLSLTDQDDVWMPRKLARHAAILATGGHAAVSSSITAFDDAAHSCGRAIPNAGSTFSPKAPVLGQHSSCRSPSCNSSAGCLTRNRWRTRPTSTIRSSTL